MPRTALLAMIALTLLLVVPRASHAQSQVALSADVAHAKTCVESFYDPDHYNWYSFKNTCSESINVTACHIEGTGACLWSATIKPGKSSSTGETRAEVQNGGGMRYYVCPAGYTAMGPNNKFLKHGDTSYVCQKE